MPDAYRGIALECAPFKVLTKLLLNRILPQAMLHIPDEQFGFITGRSTIQAIERVLDIIWDATHTNGGFIYAIYVDYAKAFDGVNRTLLMKKLTDTLGQRNPYLQLI